MRDLTATIARSRWLLDLDADPVAVDRHLARRSALGPLIAKAPGRRVPRCVDGAETGPPGSARSAGLDRGRAHPRRPSG